MLSCAYGRNQIFRKQIARTLVKMGAIVDHAAANGVTSTFQMLARNKAIMMVLQRTRRHWALIAKAVRVRRIALYWQRVSVEKTFCPGSRGVRCTAYAVCGDKRSIEQLHLERMEEEIVQLKRLAVQHGATPKCVALASAVALYRCGA